MSRARVVKIIVNGVETTISLDARKNVRSLMTSAMVRAGAVGDVDRFELRDRDGVGFDHGVRVGEYLDAINEGQPLFLTPRAGVGA